MWSDPTTENPFVGATEEWEIYNFTMDAHPIHIHLIQFQVVDRQTLEVDADGNPIAIPKVGAARQPEAWETGYKDTVIAYPGEVTRVRAHVPARGPVRVALPHPRARGQRDDAAVLRRQLGGVRPAQRQLSRTSSILSAQFCEGGRFGGPPFLTVSRARCPIVVSRPASRW